MSTPGHSWSNILLRFPPCKRFCTGTSRRSRVSNVAELQQPQENIDRVLHLKEQTQGRLSIRSAKGQLNLRHSTVHSILKKDLKLHPYKPLKTSLLTESHRQQRANFCKWIVDKHTTDPLFHRRIIFSDETQQDLNPSVNHQNNRRWSFTQPHDWEEKTGQGPKAMAWSGMNWYLGALDTYWIDGSLNSDRYHELISTRVVPSLVSRLNSFEGYPFELINFIFQQDGATSHTTVANRLYLESQFDFIISRFAAVPWPSNSPDLAPCDYALWPIVKSSNGRFSSLGVAKQAFEANMAAVPLVQVQKAVDNFIVRCRLCLQANGGHFPYK